jgi:hypothetical protein
MKGAGIVTLCLPVVCADGGHRSRLFSRAWSMQSIEDMGVAVFQPRGGASVPWFLVAIDRSGDIVICLPTSNVVGFAPALERPPDIYDLDPKDPTT